MKNVIFKYSLLIALLPLLIGIVSSAYAVDNSVAVSATVPSTVEMSSISDLSIGSISMGSAANATATACVYSNTGATGAYQITFTSANASSGQPRMQGATTTTNYLTYNIYWDDRVDGSAYSSALTSGAALDTQDTNGISSAYPCSTNNAILKATVGAGATGAIRAQSYSDTLTISIATT